VIAGRLDGAEFIINTSNEPNDIYRGLTLALW